MLVYVNRFSFPTLILSSSILSILFLWSTLTIYALVSAFWSMPPIYVTRFWTLVENCFHFLVFLDPLGNLSALIINFLHKFIPSLLAFGNVIHAQYHSSFIKITISLSHLSCLTNCIWVVTLLFHALFFSSNKFYNLLPCYLIPIRSHGPKTLLAYFQNSPRYCSILFIG
jgi:hypothetical protein